MTHPALPSDPFPSTVLSGPSQRHFVDLVGEFSRRRGLNDLSIGTALNCRFEVRQGEDPSSCVTLNLEADLESNLLHFHTILAELPEPASAPLCRQLLSASLFARGGAYFGLHAEGHTVILFHSIPLNGLPYGFFEEMVAQFIQTAYEWKEKIVK